MIGWALMARRVCWISIEYAGCDCIGCYNYRAHLRDATAAGLRMGGPPCP